MPAFGPVGVTESFSLRVGPGDRSDPFPVPPGFTGHVYVHGVGGNHMAVFVVGSDGNAQFAGGGGFLQRVQQNQMPNVTLEQVAPLRWAVIDLPSFGAPGTRIAVGLVGVRIAENQG